MTKQEALNITNLWFEVEKRAYDQNSTEEDRQVYLAWLKMIEKDYEKAQKVLLRYYK